MEYLKELRKEKIYQNSSENELYKLNEISNTIGNYINENKEELKPIESTLNLVTGEEKTNTEVNDSYGNKVIVPAGFKIINPEDNVTDGIIIQDIQAGDERSKGNQFVWIPVGTIRIDNRENSKEVLLGRYTFDGNGTPTLVQAAYTDENSKNYEQLVAIIDSDSNACYEYATRTNPEGIASNGTDGLNAIAKDLEGFVNSVKN